MPLVAESARAGEQNDELICRRAPGTGDSLHNRRPLCGGGGGFGDLTTGHQRGPAVQCDVAGCSRCCADGTHDVSQ